MTIDEREKSGEKARPRRVFASPLCSDRVTNPRRAVTRARQERCSFTAASATLQYALLNDLRPYYGATLYVAGLVGTGVGQLVVGAALRRYGRPSLIVLIIAGIIGGSTLVMSITGVWTFANELKEGKSQGFRPLCENTLVDD